MTTRAHFVLKENRFAPYHLSYCHCDGYPSGLGFTLSRHYTDPEKVRKLFELGACSHIGPELGPGGNAQLPSGKMVNLPLGRRGTSAFRRDWKRDDSPTLAFKSYSEMLASCNWDVEFLYLGRRHGNRIHWKVASLREAPDPVTRLDVHLVSIDRAIEWEKAEEAFYKSQPEKET